MQNTNTPGDVRPQDATTTHEAKRLGELARGLVLRLADTPRRREILRREGLL